MLGFHCIIFFKLIVHQTGTYCHFICFLFRTYCWLLFLLIKCLKQDAFGTFFSFVVGNYTSRRPETWKCQTWNILLALLASQTARCWRFPNQVHCYRLTKFPFGISDVEKSSPRDPLQDTGDCMNYYSVSHDLVWSLLETGKSL